ncbi:hypothetical protein AMTRI_Chr03g46500 [Amborella trichopoda]
MNLQPSEAEAGFDIRVPPNADPLSLERRIAEEWAPTSRNMTFQFKQKVPIDDNFGNPAVTATDASNPWWGLLEGAIMVILQSLSSFQPQPIPAILDREPYQLSAFLLWQTLLYCSMTTMSF